MSKKPPSAAPKMIVVWILVTPKMAAEWLDQNEGNRNLRQAKVAAFARAMTEGRWQPTHQGVSFDEQGKILDGQHRLSAVATSGISVWMLVTRGQPRTNMGVIDKGTVRSTADTLRLLYGMDNAKSRGATARLVISIKKGYFGGTYYADDEEISEELTEFAEHYDWVFEAFRGHRYAAPVLAALVYSHPINPAKVQEFAALLVEAANCPKGSIIFKAQEIARAGCKTRNVGGSERVVVFRRVLRCIQAHIRNETLKQVKDSDEGLRYFAKLRGDAVPAEVSP